MEKINMDCKRPTWLFKMGKAWCGSFNRDDYGKLPSFVIYHTSYPTRIHGLTVLRTLYSWPMQRDEEIKIKTVNRRDSIFLLALLLIGISFLYRILKQKETHLLWEYTVWLYESVLTPHRFSPGFNTFWLKKRKPDLLPALVDIDWKEGKN